MDLTGKTFVVTGASSGIGAATALLLAKRGAQVVLGARGSERLAKVAEQIEQSNGRAVPFACDVSTEEGAKGLVDQAVASFGAIDGAFNNAGMMGDTMPLADMSLSNWNAVVAGNLTSAFLCARAQIAAMHEDGGAIVNTASFVGVSNGGMAGMSAYASAKAGLIGLTQNLAIELAEQNIRVNAILPGGTDTPMAPQDADTRSFIAGLHPLGRLASPHEIAEVAVFLLSDAARFVTGSAYAVDGGVAARFV